MKFQNRNLNIGRGAQFSEFVRNILGQRAVRFSIPVDFSAQEFSRPRGLGNRPRHLNGWGSHQARRNCQTRPSLARSNLECKPRLSDLDPRGGRPFVGLVIAFWLLILGLSPAMGQATQCVETNSIKFVQPPRVDGSYDADPCLVKDATMFQQITYMEILKRGLKVMDTTAISLCKDNNLPMIIFNLNTHGNIRRVITGEKVGSLVCA